MSPPSQSTMASAEATRMAKDFVTFLNRAVTPFHAVEECSKLLLAAGFNELKESETWKLEPKQKYFVTRNKSAIVAFAVGGQYKPSGGFSMVVGHTDSPCLRVKPRSKLTGSGFQQVGVSVYGGGLWRTWFDRDLTVAGRIIFKQGDNLVHRLVNLEKPLLFIPNLAIHLETDRETFAMNKEEHLKPILATVATDALNNPTGTDTAASAKSPSSDTLGNDHHSTFLKLVANNAGCQVDQIVDMDLYLLDTQPAAITGAHNEFICGARLDNLVGTYTAVTGLIESLKDDAGFAKDMNIRIAACFDNEECGSESAQGAASAVTEWFLRRMASGGHASAFEEAVSKSYLISADQAHACHPNYRAKHEENHQPVFHGGVVVKTNVNQRYATTGITHAILKVIAEKAQVPLQNFVVRNDSPCGSTVGPILSAKLGLQTIDVGTAQFAMHSIREMTDTSGVMHAINLFTTFYNTLPGVLSNFKM